MTIKEGRIAGPERPGGQGLDANQEESGNRAIAALLTDPVRGEQTDLVITYRDAPDGQGAYEVWAKRGMIRFQRFYEDGGGYGYRIVEQIGDDPIANQDPTAVATLAAELEAGAASGYSGTDPAQAFVEPEHLSYPLALERIAQLFDSPNAPDIVISPKSYAFGRQPGQHGALDVVQSRAPLVFSGPGIKPGMTDAICAQVDVAPTLALLLGLPLIDGKDASGRTSSERGVKPDVYLKRQDGKPIVEILDLDGNGQPRSRPERVYIMLLDGLSNTELQERLEKDAESIPNLRRLVERGAMFRYGTIVTFPSITWPSHNTLGTGAWCGHHDVVNPAYYLRESRQTVAPQAMQFDTAKFLGDGVETLYEAVHRAFGTWDGGKGALTASINEPCCRGAGHSTLERRIVGDADRMKEISRSHYDGTSRRWKEDGQEGVYRYSRTDTQGLAQSLLLFGDESHPAPILTYHEFTVTDAVGHDYGPHHEAIRTALAETDKRIGEILALMERRGLLESTLFVVTADHGMAPIDTELAANQVQAVLDAGLKAVIPAPLVYLLDMDVTLEPAADGRTVTVTVLENDADIHGVKPPVANAEVRVQGEQAAVLAEAKTDAFGVAGLTLPVDADPTKLVVSVHSDRFNPRHLRLDGTNVVAELRERLYGS
ncbi:MAG: alkaline phosphatase family protein [Chloroflexi bacterium]|nr:alkaline phosphatase family protein [Chloroflexota bacterium]